MAEVVESWSLDHKVAGSKPGGVRLCADPVWCPVFEIAFVVTKDVKP